LWDDRHLLPVLRVSGFDAVVRVASGLRQTESPLSVVAQAIVFGRLRRLGTAIDSNWQTTDCDGLPHRALGQTTSGTRYGLAAVLFTRHMKMALFPSGMPRRIYIQ
jgi:hypothetical protein